VTEIQDNEINGPKLAGEGSTDLGPVDWIEGNELINVGVGPLEKGLGVAVDLLEILKDNNDDDTLYLGEETIYKGDGRGCTVIAGTDLWPSRARQSR
jgi:hypothetical protein